MASKSHDRAIEDTLAERLTQRREYLYMREGVAKDNLYSQRSVGARLGVTHACISQWESGVNCPNSFRQWTAWARVLGMNLRIDFHE